MPDSRPQPRGPRGQPLNSLATKIILFVFVSTFATALIVSWISIQSSHTYIRRLLDGQYPHALNDAAEAQQRWLGSGRAELRELAARNPGEKELVAALARSKRFETLLLLDPDGGLRATVGAPIRLEAAPEPTDAGLALLPTGDGVLPVAFCRLPGKRDRDRGILLGVFARSATAALLARARPDSDSVIFLVDSEGRVAAASEAIEPPGARFAPALLARPEGAVHEFTDWRGLHVIGSWRPLGALDARVAIQVPFEVAFVPVIAVVTRIFVIDLCIILFFSFLAYKITSAIVKPVEVLSEGARRVAQGQFDTEIPEPASEDEIGLLIRTFNDMMRKLRRYRAEIEEANSDLRERNEELRQAKETFEQLSITDGLTKLHNHRFFQDHLTREIKRVNRTGEPLSMLLVDIDDFKSLNDRLGHAAGDDLLQGIARIMNDSIRESDLLARYGGEEFVVLASNTDLAGGTQLAQKTCTRISEHSFILDDSLRPARVTVSIGVAQYKGNRKHFFQQADRALYRAKAEGKNCVVVDEDA